MPIRGPHFEVDAPVREFADLRSARHSRKRGHDQLHKYGRYRHVNRGQRNAPHWAAGPDVDCWGPALYMWPVDKSECAHVVAGLTGREFYRLARDELEQKAYRCRCCHRRTDSWRRKRTEELRGMKLAKQQAHRWMTRGGEFPVKGWTGAPDGLYDCPEAVWVGFYRDHYEFLIDEEDWIYGTVEPISMQDIVRMRDAEALAIDNYDDTASDVSDWSDVASLASWVDEDIDGVVVDARDLSYDSDWSEIDGEDARQYCP